MTRIARSLCTPILLALVGLALTEDPALAQIRREEAPRVCRKLSAGMDPHHLVSAYESCCDIDGGTSRWRQRSDGKDIDKVMGCFVLGIKPGPASLAQKPITLPVPKGIPDGRYTCQIGIPVPIRLSSGRYRSSDDGSSGTYTLLGREQDSIGGFARYAIRGGVFDGYQFLHRDNGQLQVGQRGWGRCEPGR